MLLSDINSFSFLRFILDTFSFHFASSDLQQAVYHERFAASDLKLLMLLVTGASVSTTSKTQDQENENKEQNLAVAPKNSFLAEI